MPTSPLPCAVRSVLARVPAAVLVLFCLSSALFLFLNRGPYLFALDEAGYPDSYILYDALHYLRTGEIYRAPGTPPLHPTQYSPLVYMLLALPGRLFAWDNPFVGPRLMIWMAFLLCVGVTASLTKRLIPVRLAWLWGAGLALSVQCMARWVPQLRGDFPGILCGLLAIRLLMARFRGAVWLAGVSAGLATHWKLTFVAALGAGALWLLARRRWREFVAFTVSGGAGAAGLYAWFAWQEPRMWSQMFALAPPVLEYRGFFRMVLEILREPVLILAVAGLPAVILRPWPRWWLLVLYAALSVGVATATGVQAGANTNYFYEAALALVPVSVLAVLRITGTGQGGSPAGLFASALLFLFFAGPATTAALSAVRPGGAGDAIRSRNQQILELSRVLAGRKILSTIPRVAIMTPDPLITEPYLISYMRRTRNLDLGFLTEPLRRREFELVVTAATATSHRGIALLSPEVRQALGEGYEPYCAYDGMLMHRRRGPVPENGLETSLTRIGCKPVNCARDPICDTW